MKRVNVHGVYFIQENVMLKCIITCKPVQIQELINAIHSVYE